MPFAIIRFIQVRNRDMRGVLADTKKRLGGADMVLPPNKGVAGRYVRGFGGVGYGDAVCRLWQTAL